MVVVALLIIAGAVEAGWALLQVFGLLPSHHALYPMTGSFGNPGPLSGLLAMVFPVAVVRRPDDLERDGEELPATGAVC